jgi:predicted nucleic acid-binding protein
MFLVDSSAWIEYLRPNGSPAVKTRVRGLLEREEACICGVVLVEVLRGARTEKDWTAVHESLTALPHIPIDAAVIDKAARWGFQLDRKGATFSTTDRLIAAAAHGQATLVHRDRDFTRIAAMVRLKEEYVPEDPPRRVGR